MHSRRRPRRVLLRLIVVWIVTAAAIGIAGAVLSGVTVEDAGAAFASAALISLVNALLWPVAIRLLLPITVLTLGLGALVPKLDGDIVEGEDPLEPFGPNAARHVRRTDGFAHCPDIVLNSTYWHELDEVAAFEELVGSHGGMGGAQSYPFILHPAELALPDEMLIGAEAVHRELRGWLAALGHTAYAREAAAA